MLATHEPASTSPVVSSSNHIQNQIKEHVSQPATVLFLSENRTQRKKNIVYPCLPVIKGKKISPLIYQREKHVSEGNKLMYLFF
jgi:hypothetical protein